MYIIKLSFNGYVRHDQYILETNLHSYNPIGLLDILVGDGSICGMYMIRHAPITNLEKKKIFAPYSYMGLHE